ncbi:3-ketoacyl-ACP reductase [Luteitalea sp. TBR-22]|uniref:SDR family NAD(P)-dependent oxidoreductase n=1 Tax=Luteitalea sp. TBR-22 TaxID=2802971 RepID=UPI001AF11EF7|nr:SDR family NAD(P)-dependent oxidoreductase [Luteitalea sp. TBR-22]BCS33184.1 3-ketoacyl-ACP reductase [Luteitalea sp. TBR-22]
MKIAGTIAVVTGGASGIGKAFAQRLLARGATVWILDRDQAALAQAVAELQPDGDLRHIRCDVGDEAAVVQAVREIDEQSGGVDILVNNAAVLRDQALVSRLGRHIRQHSTADWHETLHSNLTSVFLMSRQVGESMLRRRRGGLIVNISSISRLGNAGQTAYAASKAAVAAMTVTWSQELAPYGIRVVGIAPGFVETPMTRAIPPLFLEQLRERTPQKRFGTLEEFKETLEFVIVNDYLNGKILEVDGGLRF